MLTFQQNANAFTLLLVEQASNSGAHYSKNEGGAKPTKLAHGSVAFRLDGKAAGVDGDVGGTTGSYRW